MTQFATQLIIFGKRNSENPDSVFQDVKEAGFASVEASNLFRAFGEDEGKRLLSEYGITLSGLHSGAQAYGDAEALTEDIAFAKFANVRNFMCSGILGEGNAENYKKSAALFNEIGKRLADEGMAFNYHNHDWEFATLDNGATGMEILLAETDPAYVKLNIDVFWLYYAEQDVEGFIRANADRTGYFHFKDGHIVRDEEGAKRPEFLELGNGDVDLKAAYAAAQEVGADWIVAEQDATKLEPLESLTISREYLAMLESGV